MNGATSILEKPTFGACRERLVIVDTGPRGAHTGRGQVGSRITLVAAVVQRDFLVLRRYLFNLVSGLVSLYILFLIVFFGAQRLGGTDVAYGNTLDGIVVGFVVWSFAITAFSELAWGIT